MCKCAWEFPRNSPHFHVKPSYSTIPSCIEIPCRSVEFPEIYYQAPVTMLLLVSLALFSKCLLADMALATENPAYGMGVKLG